MRNISVIGLGYVGLPVAVAFGELSKVVGFDINQFRIDRLKNGFDDTLEVETATLKKSDILFTSTAIDLKNADFHIIAVPTPVDKAHRPDLSPLIGACEVLGPQLKKGDIVVFESTVYPGVTEDECAPVLEKLSGLKSGVDFKLGYSPERINPGDKEHTFTKIIKVVAGQDEESLNIIADTYSSAVVAGVYKASSIKVAEAAKVIENTQRDLNIALVNELAIIFDKMDIDTLDVLEAAGTKWNFLPFRPGLVGGHCIGVDPYYLTYKSEMIGHKPEVILSGRRINDKMGKFIAYRTIKEMIKFDSRVKNSIVTILGLTFKENCPDLRNSKVVDIIKELKEFGVQIQIYDPLISKEDAKKYYDLEIVEEFENLEKAEALILAVPHSHFLSWDLSKFKELLLDNPIIMDVKSCLNKQECKKENIHLWRL
ncbi:MAG: GDP-mannose dehydrogenase [Planctomycetota bacterium]|nr:MAG: GDP-mannose dehydrogenase [Planctomycetota bacterium]